MNSHSELKWSTFPATSYEEWKNSAITLLKGADFDKKLVLKMYDGFSLQPLYTAKDTLGTSEELRPLRYESAPWRVAYEYDANAESENVQDVKKDLAAGVNEVWVKDIGTARSILRELNFSKHRLCFIPSLKATMEAKKFVEDFKKACQDGGCDPKNVVGSFNFDPIGMMALTGKNMANTVKDVASAFASAVQIFPQMKVLLVNGEHYANAGASDSHELSYVIAGAIEYLRALDAEGIKLETALSHMAFGMTAGSEFFAAVAKLRAARLLWTHVAKESGFAIEKQIVPLWLHVKTAERGLTKKDPWINILRGTTTAWAAAVGGADSCVVTPFDYRLGEANELAHRVAKNTQLILQEESNLSYVDDPAAGSYFLEKTTKDICETAWNLVQKLEGQGGLVKTIEARSLYAEIDALHEERIKNIRKRKDIVTGVSEFPLLKEAPIERTKKQREIACADRALKMRALAKPFEELREKSDEFLAKKGHRPRVVMLTLGPTSQHIARSVFTQNFIEAGGLEVHTMEGEKGPEAISSMLKELKTDVVVFAAPDALYETDGERFVKSLREIGVKTTLVAGRPTDAMKTWDANTFLFLGCDAVSVYEQVWSRL